MEKRYQVAFAVLPNVHLIDLAGPVQVFYEANEFGAGFDIRYAGLAAGGNIPSRQGLAFEALPSYRHLSLGEEDYLFLCGIEFSAIRGGQFEQGYEDFFRWLREQFQAGVRICSVCSGAFVLAESRLLNGRTCTTHWKCLDYMRERYPFVKVVDDQLFVRDGNLYTSAGMTSGIDLALYIVEELYGPVLTAKVSREMVVYLRRPGGQSQGSMYLDFRTHIHPAIHQVQDLILQNPGERSSLADLAARVHLSERHLTRLFRLHTGISIQEYRTRVRLERAETLMRHPGHTLDFVAGECGFADGRQLRRLWQDHYGTAPSTWKGRPG